MSRQGRRDRSGSFTSSRKVTEVSEPPVGSGHPLLEIRDLALHYQTQEGKVRALNGIDLTVRAGEIRGVVGETGSGKSVTARAILGILEDNASVTSGQILFSGMDLLQASQDRLQALRGKEITLVFQDARSALNPVFTVGHQLSRVAMFHGIAKNAREGRARAVGMLRKVQINDPERRARQYPHELSGGMCQRVMIAMALLCSPKLIVLDEPTTGLDVTVQASILDLIREVVAATETGVLFITHDLGVVAEVCETLSVMYAGQVVEDGPVTDVFAQPRHPYTLALGQANLSLDHDVEHPGISSIRGTVPDPLNLEPGCQFAPRCDFRTQVCSAPVPSFQVAEDRMTRCFNTDLLEGVSIG